MAIYSRGDVANILSGLGSAEAAAEREQVDRPTEYELTEYERGRREGFKAALVAVGLSVGLGPMVRHWRSDGPTWIEVDGNE